MIRRPLALFAAATVAATSLLAPQSAVHSLAATSLTGAGSTFDEPFFAKAFSVYGRKHNLSINYQAIGSGAGIQQFIAKTVDFGATDVPMDPTSELPKAVSAGGAVVQIPVVLGGVSITYNLPGVKSGLHLSAGVLSAMFLGLIHTWNDPQIKKLNTKVKLPDLPVTIVHRSDGSGTSYIFTDYLSKVSDVWRGHVGTGKLPNWPTGVGAKGNEGVAGVITQTPGAVGYVELAYVVQNHMSQAALQNRSKQFVTPTLKSVAAAAAQFPKVSPTKYSIVNAKGKSSYPISGYSWVLLFKHQNDKAKGKTVSALFQWLTNQGQAYAKKLDYAPLPAATIKANVTLLKMVK